MDVKAAESLGINYILCAERTGSTLLSAMLNMHPNILSTIEEPFSLNLYPRYKGIPVWTSETIGQYCRDFYAVSNGWLELQFCGPEDFRALLESHKEHLTVDLAIRLTYLCFFPAKPKDQVTTVVDKQLILHGRLEELARTYPHSKFIILCRDPRDNTLVRFRKCQKQNWKTNYVYLSLAWNHVYGLLYGKQAVIGADRFLSVRYEDLVAAPEVELGRICAFLELPYDANMLRYDEYLKEELPKVFGNSSDQVQKSSFLAEGLTQKAHTDKVGFWKNNLAETEIDLIWGICGKLAGQIDYPAEGCQGHITRDAAYYKSYARFWFDYVLFEKLYLAAPFSLKGPLRKLIAKLLWKG